MNLKGSLLDTIGDFNLKSATDKLPLSSMDEKEPDCPLMSPFVLWEKVMR